MTRKKFGSESTDTELIDRGLLSTCLYLIMLSVLSSVLFYICCSAVANFHGNLVKIYRAKRQRALKSPSGYTQISLFPSVAEPRGFGPEPLSDRLMKYDISRFIQFTAFPQTSSPSPKTPVVKQENNFPFPYFNRIRLFL